MAALDRYDEWDAGAEALLAGLDQTPPTDGDPLAEVYDQVTLDAIDGERAGSRSGGTLRSRAAAGAVVMGLVAGMREVFEPEREAVVEEDRVEAPRLEAVTVHLAWGNPSASVAIVRRWLL